MNFRHRPKRRRRTVWVRLLVRGGLGGRVLVRQHICVRSAPDRDIAVLLPEINDMVGPRMKNMVLANDALPTGAMGIRL